ncbi:MAG TPA: 50S ribosomal protein L4 [Egibacteraceae bacterium]|nr:50S ribosomal protein L4 [Egibacteraceae bacterium]
MPTVDVLDLTGAATGTVQLDTAVFDIEPNVAVMHQVVTAQLAAARAGSAKTKSRSEVRGGGRKPWRQKGTGRARHGSIRAPQWTGGGVAHGPSGAQNHTKRVPKKLKRLALRSALSDRARSGDVRVVKGLAFDAPRTKDAMAFLQALDLADRWVLLVLAGRDETLGKSFRNLPGVHTLTVDQLNTYDVLCSDVVVFQQEALASVAGGAAGGEPAVPAAARTASPQGGDPGEGRS